MPELIVDPCVEVELCEIRGFIALENPPTAERLIEAVHETLRNLLVAPKIGRPRHFSNARLKGVRSWRVSGFERYHVFYRPLPKGIHVIHVYHDARDIEALFGSR